MTFSVTFHGRSFDEASYVREVARSYGTRHTEFDLNPGQDLPQAIHELAYYCDEPNADSGALPVWFLSRMTQGSCDGRSERRRRRRIVRWIPDPSRETCSRQGAPATAVPCWRLLLAAARRLPVSNEKIGFEYKLKRFLEGCLMPAARAHIYWGGAFGDEDKRRCCRQALPPALESILVAGGGSLQDYLWFDQKYFLPDNILTKVDHTSMAHSVEVRPPFLDHRIVEFANSLPAGMKIQGSRKR